MKSRLRLLSSSLIALTGVVLLTDVSQAQPGRGGVASVWKYLAERYDKNKDGKIAKHEYDRGAETFARLDRTNDGVLTPEDWGVTRPFGSSPGQRPGVGLRGVAPKKGAVALDFELTHITDPSKTIKLSSFVGKKPVALIFGSCT